MYQIFADDICIYDESSDDITLKITDGKLTLEDNSAGSLEFTMPSSNVGYDSINRMRTHVVLKRDGEKIFGGRALSMSTDFYKNQTIFCEGELAYLNDTYQPIHEYNEMTLRQYIESVLMVHNDKCNGEVFNESAHMDKRIYIGAVTVNDGLEMQKRYTDYESTMTILAKLVESYGGHMLIRTEIENGKEKLYLDYFQDYPNRNTQTVEFAKNLLDYSKNYDLSDLCTVLLPLGAKKDTSETPGDEVEVRWNDNSIITEDGEVRLSKYFYMTDVFGIQKTSTYYEYKSSTDETVEKTETNTLTITCEQVDGFGVCTFYNASGQVIPDSTFVASATGNRSVARYYNRSVTIPDGASKFSCGYYYSPDSTYSFKAVYSTHFGTTEWKHGDTYRVDSLYSTAVSKPGWTLWANGEAQRFMNNDNAYRVSDPIYVKSGQTFYLTARQDSGYGMYCAYLAGGTPVTSVITAGTGTGFTDLVKEKLGDFPAGTKYFRIAGKFNCGLDPKLYMDVKNDDAYYNPPDDYVTIESVNSNSLYLKNDALISQYGWIEKQINFDDAKNPSDLLQVARKYLNNSQFGQMVLQVKAFDMHLIDSSIEAIDLLDKVRCKSTPHGMDVTLPVTKLEIPILSPQNAQFTLGTESTEIKSLTGANAANDLEIFTRLDTDIPRPSSILKSAVANATALINQRTNGFVTVDPHELLIMDDPDKDSAEHLWRMNVNGIGYSKNGYDGPYGLAFTMDGAIVADKITTGHMHADRIRGGTLTLGGYDNVNGEFYMKNEQGKTFIKMSKDGAEMIAKISQAYLWTVDRIVHSIYDIESIPRYAVTEIANGAINAYTCEISAEVATSSTTSRSNWWKNYSFSFNDIKSKSLATGIYLLKAPDSEYHKSSIRGITMNSASYFSLWLTAPGETKSMSVPHIELNSVNKVSSIIFDGSNSGFVGIYYDGLADNSYATNPYTDSDFYETSGFSCKTLVIRNDGYSSNYNSSLRGQIGSGGIYLYSRNSLVGVQAKEFAFIGNKLTLTADDICITKGTVIESGMTTLTSCSRSIPIITGITSNGNGGISWTSANLIVQNGFVTGLS